MNICFTKYREETKAEIYSSPLWYLKEYDIRHVKL
jgi:hypothetical protein